MWHIKTHKSNLYLAGSIHALNRDFYPFANAYAKAFDSVDNLVVEINIAVLDPLKTKAKIKALTWLEEDQSLAGLFAEQDEAALLEMIQTRGLTKQALLKMRPWVLLEMITAQQLAQTNFKANLGVDQFFIKRAQEQTKNILELETLDEQINGINGAPLRAQVAAISLALSQLNEGQQQLNQLAGFWQRADADGLYQYAQEDMLAFPEIKPLMKSLIDDRNQTMADKVAKLIESGGSYFVMVGALHLAGPNSVQNQLIKQGYSLEKVSP